MSQLDPEKQRDFAVDVVRTLRMHGFEAYWAGGCVRDRLLGRLPKDYDVATTALPEQIREVFGRRRTVPVGAQFGVITVVGPKPAGRIEVATFRRDITYSDGRRPDAVEFSTPQADAQRRDFTINGLFYDPLEDRVIDYVGGVDDLGRGIVRAIGEPRARFEEDKLRLLRAVRFSAAFDFTLDLPTREAVEAMAEQIVVVSAERIAAEMRWMLTHRSRTRALVLLKDVGLLRVILPELAMTEQPSTPMPGGQADEVWLAALEALDTLGAATFPLALAALLCAFVDGEGAGAICRRWKLSNHETKRTRWLVEQRQSLVDARRMKWSGLQPILVSPGIDELLALHEAIALASGGDAEHVAHCRALLQMPRDQLDPPPLVTGDDLIALGVPRGKQYQQLLQAARDAQLDKQIATKAEAIAFANRLRSRGASDAGE